MADGGVEFYDVQGNKAVMLFLFNSFKPLDHGGGVFPLVEFGCSRDLLLILSRVTLLILPISDLVGLISLQVGLLSKFVLWFFSVINASLLAVVSTLSSIPNFAAMFLFSVWMSRTVLGWAFL